MAFLSNVYRFMPFWTKVEKASYIVRIWDRRDFVIMNKMCVFVVQVRNRISLIPENKVEFGRVGEVFTF